MQPVSSVLYRLNPSDWQCLSGFRIQGLMPTPFEFPRKNRAGVLHQKNLTVTFSLQLTSDWQAQFAERSGGVWLSMRAEKSVVRSFSRFGQLISRANARKLV
jgi:hypothetical protein